MKYGWKGKEKKKKNEQKKELNEHRVDVIKMMNVCDMNF